MDIEETQSGIKKFPGQPPDDDELRKYMGKSDEDDFLK